MPRHTIEKLVKRLHPPAKLPKYLTIPEAAECCADLHFAPSQKL